MQALQGDGDQRGQRIEQRERFVAGFARLFVKGNRQHAPCPHRCLEWEVQRGVTHAAHFIAADELAALESDMGEVCFDRQTHLRAGSQDLAFRVGKQHGRIGGQLRTDKAVGDVDYLFVGQRASELLGQLIQSLGLLLAPNRFLGSLAQYRGEMRGRQGCHQHDDEGDQVLDVADRQREAGWHEENIETQNADDGSQDGGIATELDGNDQNREQKEHHDIGQVEIAQQRRRQQGRARTGSDRQRNALGAAVIFFLGGGIERHFAFPITG